MDEPSVERLSVHLDRSDLFTVTILDDSKDFSVRLGESHLVKDRHGHDILRISRRICVDTHCVEHIPCRSLAGIVHSGIRKAFLAHSVIILHKDVQDALALLLLADEVVCIRKMTSRLVSMAILAKEACNILSLNAAPWLREEGVKLRLNNFLGRVHIYDFLHVMHREEKKIPCIRLAPHMMEIRIIRIEIPYPTTVRRASLVESVLRIEDILVVLRLFDQLLIIFLIAYELSNKSCRIVVVCIFKHLLCSAFEFDVKSGSGRILI